MIAAMEKDGIELFAELHRTVEITVIGVGRQQRLMREPYFARTEAAARQRQHRMMREAQRIFDGLALIGHAIQQDLEAHEMPIADAVILDLNPHDRSVHLQMTRPEPGGLAPPLQIA